MTDNKDIIFKIATTKEEIEQIHELNYQVFVEEIAQHQTNTEKRLVDKFHGDNTYFIALVDNQVIALTAIKATRPFSLDEKMNNLDSYFPKNKSLVEARLFCIKKEYRKSTVLLKLLRMITEHVVTKKYDICVISGILNQLPLYYRMGYQPFCNQVASGQAIFQPVYAYAEEVWYKINDERFRQEKIYLTPGPVKLKELSLNTLAKQQISHRNNIFSDDLKEVKHKLSELVHCKYSIITHGS